MNSNDIFPSKLATGDYFCNRTKERQLLADNIRKSRHTVLVSPRRYGKSSLVHYVISELNLPCTAIDLFLAHNDRSITKRLISGIAEALSIIMPVEQKALKVIKQFFKGFHASMEWGTFNLELTHREGEIDAVDQVYNALKGLAQLADKQNQKIIIFIDEFQDIAVAESAKSIQGAIRHVAQETDSLMFIFSGSNRHFLLELFDDRSMPLYMLCDKIHLDRMQSTDYHPHIQKLAMQKWGQELSERVLLKALTLAELHPFYVNLLLNKLWQGSYPEDSDHVETVWQQCMEDEQRRIRAELEKLSRNQQEALKILAKYPTPEPTGRDFSHKSQLAASSLHQTFKALFEHDVVFRVTQSDPNINILKPNQVRVLDPLIAYYLKTYF